MKSRLCFAILFALFLAGCSGTPSWLQGDWVFDQDRTQQEMQKADADRPLGGLTDMLGNLAFSQLSTMELIISGTTETQTVNGQGTSSTFQVVTSSSDECVLKKPDGTVETYYHDGNALYTYGTGALHLKIYFKRKS